MPVSKVDARANKLFDRLFRFGREAAQVSGAPTDNKTTRENMKMDAIWIQSLSENLTDEQKEKIDDVAHEEVFNSCLQDRSYMRSVVNSFLCDKTLLEKSHEIAGGDRDMTAETLGFDVVTGETVD